MPDITIKLETGHINLSPVAFRLWAQDYYECYLSFVEKQQKFSPVPFFLCCRAIELALKAKHLETKSQNDVKDLYRHDLIKSYEALDPEQRVLSSEEFDLLRAVNGIYCSKAFEYFNVMDAGTGFQRFPDLAELNALTRRIVEYDT